MSAMISSLVTDDSRALAALTIAPLFIDEQGSSANSVDADFITSPVRGKRTQSVMYYDRKENVNTGNVVLL